METLPSLSFMQVAVEEPYGYKINKIGHGTIDWKAIRFTRKLSVTVMAVKRSPVRITTGKSWIHASGADTLALSDSLRLRELYSSFHSF